MVTVTFIDNAVKSFVELPRKAGSRIVYSRAEILSRKHSKHALQKPPIFNAQGVMLGRRKIFYDSQYFEQNNMQDHKMYNKVIYVARDNPALDDDAIVSVERKLAYSEQRSEINSSTNIETDNRYHVHPKHMKRVLREPEWYTHAPQNLEESLEEIDAAVANKENENSIIFSATHKYSKNLDIQKQIPESTGRSTPKSRSDRPLNIKTLREIESKMDIPPGKTVNNGNMSAYYKLLGLLGSAIRNQEINNKFLREEKMQINPNEKGDSQNKLSDPAITEIVEDTCVKELVEPSFRNRQTCESLVQKELRSEETFPYHPVATSYQRQVMASGPFGHDALRWFKAMTNAASASACINQRLDTPSTECSAPGTYTNSIENLHHVESEINETNVNENEFPQTSPTFDSGRINSKPNGAFGFSQEYIPSTVNLGMHMGLSHRAIRPLLFYYQPHATNWFGRPVVHPFLLQQLMQRQLEFKSSLLQSTHMQPGQNEHATYANNNRILNATLNSTELTSYDVNTNAVKTDQSSTLIQEYPTNQ